MKECITCGFWNVEFQACTCASWEAWYACPIESKKPENQKALREYAEQVNQEKKETMTVKELINELNQIENKDAPVTIDVGIKTYSINCIVRNNHGSVIILT